MAHQRPTYEELRRQLFESNMLVDALRHHEIDAIIGESSVAVVRLREVEEELKQARRLAEERARELEAFSYSVSHDLRAPLRAITGFSTILMDKHAERMEDEARLYLERIVHGAEKMSALIEDMLTLSQIGKHELRRKKIDLHELAEAIIRDIRREEPQRRVEVRIAADMIIDADRRLMTIALANLLRNAWKFTSKREEARIDIGMSDEDGCRIFYVRDNGAGFDMRHADRLFAAFQRLHSEAEFPGTGIGLAVVRRVITKHSGTIWAHSAPGEGSTFFFTLS